MHPILDKAVMQVAGQMPDSWSFVPATKNGKYLDSEYHIAIEFELNIIP